jgi:hypothetical protein
LYIAKQFNQFVRAASPPATWPNNDADANALQGLKLE